MKGRTSARMAICGPSRMHTLDVWLTHVFRVMGWFVLETGALAVTLAATSFRTHEPGVGLGALIGGSASIGSMAFTNFLSGPCLE